MASSSAKGGLEGDHNPWAPAVPDLLSDEPSPEESPEEPSEQPPQYSDARHATPSDPTQATRSSRTPLPQPSLPLHKYIIPISIVSPDRTTTTTKHAPFYDNADELLTFLKDQVLLPPKPTIHIVGKHNTYSHSTITDFDLTLNLTPLLIRPDGQSWSYLKFPPPPTTPGPSQPPNPRDSKRKPTQIPSRTSLGPPQSLEALARAFATDPSPSKSLTLTRGTTNLDTSYLHGQALALLAQTQYKGDVQISFPNTYGSVVIQKGTPLAQGLRSFLSTAASWVTLGKAPVRPTAYGVECVWPFATSASHASLAEADGERGRKVAVQSEVEWWGTWAGVVRNGVLGKKKGWLGSEDWAEAAMGWREEEKREPWGMSDGTSGVS